jgi:glycosyltransferase involved in cell wall biosynthesis
MRVLFVAPYLPSRIRTRPFNWIRTLANLGCSIHLVALVPPEDRWASAAPLQAVCDSVDLFELSRRQTLINAVCAIPTASPLQLAYSRHPQAAAHIAQLAGSGRFDVAHVEHLRGAVLASGVHGIPVVYDAVDSISMLFERAARLAPARKERLMARLDLRRTRRFEGMAPRRFDRTLTTSEMDRQAFLRLAGKDVADRVVVLPNGVDLSYFTPSDQPADPATVLFSGKMSYHANAAAALRLVRNIMPAVWARRPDANVVLAGKGPPGFLLELSSDRRVAVTGFLEDLRPQIRRATISVAPLVYGAGIQNKVLEAMASGVPVATTSEAAGALEAQAGEAILVADDDRSFADHILAMIEDPFRRSACGKAARRYVESRHDWRALGNRLISVYQDAVGDTQAPVR